MSGRFAGKLVLVTGAAGGIGAAAARGFRDEGARVVLSDQRPPAPELGIGGLQFVAADVTSRSEVEAMVKQIAETGPIDILVHTAAVLGGSGPFDAVPPEVFEHYIGINVMGTVHVAQAVVRSMIVAGTKGSVVLFGSLNSLAAEAEAAPYAVSKGAIRLLAKSMAVDLAAHGIRVNCIIPGAITVPRNAELFARADVSDSFSRGIPMARPGRPDELVGAMFYLADPLSSYTTGSDVVVDGGLYAFVPLK